MKKRFVLALSVIFDMAIIILFLVGFISHALAAKVAVYPGESIQDIINNSNWFERRK